MPNIGVLIGTRPEAIKLMPVIRALQRAGVDPPVFVTGQHDELLTPILAELDILPTEHLGLMEADQLLGDLSARLLRGVQDILRRPHGTAQADEHGPRRPGASERSELQELPHAGVGPEAVGLHDAADKTPRQVFEVRVVARMVHGRSRP